MTQMNPDQKFCQSCGMPMGADAVYGTEADGSKSADYCGYCYENGAFKGEMTMEQMIDFCAPHMAGPDSGMTEEQARDMMRKFFPQLKRWR